jgi:acyl carrier protein
MGDETVRLTTFIRERLVPEDRRDGFDETTPLLRSGILDSLSTATLIGFIRRELGVRIPATAIDPANFADTRAVAALVRRLAG